MHTHTLVASLLMLPTLSVAQEGQPSPPISRTDSTAQRHRGLYLHVDIGVGYLSASPSQPSGGAPSLSGATLPLSIVIGGTVAEDWVLAGDVWGTVGPSPGGAEWAATGFGALGLNVTHYFMPANVFVSLTPSFTGLLIHVGEEVPDQKSTGFGAKLAVGKDWWVDDHWWLGVAAQGLFAFNEGRGSSLGTKWTLFGGGLVFSATIN